MEDPRAKHFAKKPKSILVIDCVHLQTGRDIAEKELREARRENDRLNRELCAWKARAAGLCAANANLAEANKHLVQVSVLT